MSLLPCPQPPDWNIDWSSLDPLPWLREMLAVPQNPERHAEGDVWTHVHMVCEAMTRLPAWRALPSDERTLLFHAALLHDVAKPACTRMDSEGKITSRGHSWKGAVRGRQILWKMGIDFVTREAICAMVRHHLVPFFLIDSETPQRLAIEVSQTARCDWLSILAESDARGRTCSDPDKLLTQVEMFRQVCAEANCLDGPYQFPSDHTRFLYFRDPTRQPDVLAHDTFRADAVLLSGLPGSGKDHWIRDRAGEHEVISIDALRSELGVAPSDPQGTVLQKARELARGYLRSGQPFIWNATNLSRQVRGECLRLFHDYDAKIRIVYFEVPRDRLFAQNRARRKRVPEIVIERMMDRWEIPDLTEAHQVDYSIEG